MAEDMIKDKTGGDKFDTAFGDRQRESVSHFLENSRLKSNGIREVPKGAFMAALGKHGVTEDDLKRVQNAVDFETTAAARLAVTDLETKIGEATEEQLGDEAFRRRLSATVRLPTYGGSTDITVNAESVNNIPFRGDGENSEPQTKTSYGRLRTTVNTKMRVHRDFHTEADERIRAALKVAPAVDRD